MYIGKMGSNSYLNRIGLNHSGRNQNSTLLKWNQSFTRRDSVMISSGIAQNKCESVHGKRRFIGSVYETVSYQWTY